MRELNQIKNANTGEIENIKNLLGKEIEITIDRPIGFVHPKYKDIIYELNYGYYDEYLSLDGEGLDAYLIGESLPLNINDKYKAKVVAILHRLNDDEDKLIVAPEGREVTDDEIISKTEFMEQYFVSEIIR